MEVIDKSMSIQKIITYILQQMLLDHYFYMPRKRILSMYVDIFTVEYM